MLPFEDDPTQGWAWDDKNRRFMKRGAFHDWVVARPSVWDVGKPEYQYDPDRHPLFSEVLKQEQDKMQKNAADTSSVKIPYATPKIEAQKNGYAIKDRDGNFLFSVGEKNAAPKDTVSTAEFYKTGKQWTLQDADHYIPLDSVSPDIQNNPNVYHVDTENFYKFANEDRNPLAYGSGGDGDWKHSPEGANNFRLAEVNGTPIWPDALGQIPFAVDTYKKILAFTGDEKIAEVLTKQIGYAFAEGISLKTPFPWLWDRSNSLDNGMIQKAIDYAKKKYKPHALARFSYAYFLSHPQDMWLFPYVKPYLMKRNDTDLSSGIDLLDK